MKINVTYIISDIDKALAFEWIASKMDSSKVNLSFILILQKPAALELFLRERNIQVNTLFYSNKKDFPLVFLKLYKLLRKSRSDVVHCHLFYGSLLGLSAACLAGIKKRIYTRHHSDFHFRYFPAGIKWDKLCNRLATLVIAPSSTVSEILIGSENVPASKVRVIHHGFDLSYFQNVSPERINSLRDKYNIQNAYPVIGVISRFTELKGIQYIIPAFQRLLESHPTALLLLFNAQGDYENQIKKQLDAIQDNYRLISFENDLSAVYRLFDIFVQVSTDRSIEAFGQTYVEALAAGVPSVFTLSGIAIDFIEDGKNAILVPFKDTDAIYNAFNIILNDRDLQNTLKKNGLASIKLFSLQKFVNHLEELYVE